jgi:hypothetical protein
MATARNKSENSAALDRGRDADSSRGTDTSFMLGADLAEIAGEGWPEAKSSRSPASGDAYVPRLVPEAGGRFACDNLRFVVRL